MKKIIRLTESDLHDIIKNSVKNCLNEMGRFDSDLDADEIYGDRADREQKQAMRDKFLQDEWEMKNRRLRQKYPGKSQEWYDAMIDTFYEGKTPIRSINEDGGMVGGAAANASGFMNGANNAQTSSNAQFDVPFGSVQRRKGYSPKGNKSSKMKEVDMNPALKRKDGKGGSISIPKERV